MAQMEARPKLLETGVPNLDLVLGGGLQQHNSYLVAGPSGAGKSVLTQQIVFYRAKQGDRILLVTGLDEPHQNLLQHFGTLSFADRSLIGPQIETISLVPFLERPVPEKIDVLRRTVLNARPQLVSLDGLNTLTAFPSGVQTVYQFVYGLTSWFAVEGITLLLTKQTSMPTDTDNPEFGLVDGVILLEREVVRHHTLRQLQIWKARGQSPLGGLHSLSIDADGIKVWPRPQALLQPSDEPERRERLPFGVATLDPMLGGGLPAATATLLAGDPGTGKTILALAFLASGAQRGQPGLWLGFRSSRSRLMAAAQASGRNLSDAESRGQARFLILAPFEQDPNQLAAMLQSAIGAIGARRLVVDSAELLEGALPSRDTAHSFLAWLMRFAAQLGLTTLITQQVPHIPGQEFSMPDAPLTSLAENLIMVRQIQQEAELRRALAVVRMSSPGYDTTIREYVLDRQGITLGAPLSAQVGQAAPRATGEPVPGPV